MVRSIFSPSSMGGVTFDTIVIALFILSQVLPLSTSYQLQVPIVMPPYYHHLPPNIQKQHPRRRSDRSTSTSLLLANNDNGNSNSENMNINLIRRNTKRNTEFEYQEMKVILDALGREGVVSSNRIDRKKAHELNSYIQRIVSDRITPPATTSTNTTQQTMHSLLYNTSWTMKYTTMEILPPDTTIQLQFPDAPTAAATAAKAMDIATKSEVTLKMNYRLLFGSKTFGLNALNVQCECTTFTTDEVNRFPMHSMPLLALTFDTITMDAFGWENLPLCFLSNLILARSNRNPPDMLIHTVYFDDNIWIEQQEPPLSSNGSNDNVIWNVYRKDTDDR